LAPGLFLGLCLLFGPSIARDTESLEKNFPADRGIEQVSLEMDLDAARLDLVAHDAKDLAVCRAFYDADQVEADVEFDKGQETAELYIFTDRRSRGLDIDTDDCEWDVSLSRDYEWDMELDFGFIEGDLDLSGLKIDRLEFSVGAGECELVFSEPNPGIMRKCEIEAGAGELHVTGLGYANFDHLSFNGGAGEFVINFEGMTEGYHTAEIDVGIGEAVIELPEDFPVRIETDDGWLSSVEIKGGRLEEIDDGIYETGGFRESEKGLEIYLDVGIGKAIIGKLGDGGIILSVVGPPVLNPARGYLNGSSYFPQPEIPGIPAIPEVTGIVSQPGIPQVPECPELPDIAEIPSLAEVPALAGMVELPDMPAMPEMPEIPALPELIEIKERTGRKIPD